MLLCNIFVGEFEEYSGFKCCTVLVVFPAWYFITARQILQTVLSFFVSDSMGRAVSVGGWPK